MLLQHRLWALASFWFFNDQHLIAFFSLFSFAREKNIHIFITGISELSLNIFFFLFSQNFNFNLNLRLIMLADSLLRQTTKLCVSFNWFFIIFFFQNSCKSIRVEIYRTRISPYSLDRVTLHNWEQQSEGKRLRKISERGSCSDGACRGVGWRERKVQIYADLTRTAKVCKRAD